MKPSAESWTPVPGLELPTSREARITPLSPPGLGQLERADAEVTAGKIHFGHAASYLSIQKQPA